MKMPGGQAVVEVLGTWGVEVVFGIPGVHTLALYDALYEHPRIRHVTVRHEQGAGFMADGYARASGKVGVAITTTGPAAVNTLTPIGEAYAESSPVFLICSGQTDEMDGADSGSLHEMRNQFETLVSVTGQGTRVSKVEEIPEALFEGFEAMQRQRPRPYVLEVPLDVLKVEAEVLVPTPEVYPPTVPGNLALQAAAAAIGKAKRPLILTGGGAKDASEAVVALAERIGAAVGATGNGLGIVPADHPNYVGDAATVGELLPEVDLLIGVGTRFGQRTMRGWKTEPAHLIQLDIDSAVIGRVYHADVGLLGDAGAGIQALLDMLGEGEALAEWDFETVKENLQPPPAMDIFPTLLQVLRDILDREAVVANDMTQISYQARRLFPFFTPRSYLAPVNYGTLGFSMPAAIGAKMACPDRQVVSLSGDGGFMFTVQELLTARQQGLTLPIVVCNDNKYRAIERAQERDCEGRTIAADLHNPDFVAMARSFGVYGEAVREPEAFSTALKVALEADLPTLIEVPVHEFSV